MRAMLSNSLSMPDRSTGFHAGFWSRSLLDSVLQFDGNWRDEHNIVGISALLLQAGVVVTQGNTLMFDYGRRWTPTQGSMMAFMDRESCFLIVVRIWSQAKLIGS